MVPRGKKECVFVYRTKLKLDVILKNLIVPNVSSLDVDLGKCSPIFFTQTHNIQDPSARKLRTCWDSVCDVDLSVLVY
jgi:hypothetical protein